MVTNFSFWQDLYGLGVRRLGVTNLPPIGCLPAAITVYGAGSNQCVARLNQDATSFNVKLNNTSQSLINKLPSLKLVVFDVYQPLLDMINSPSDSGMCLFCKWLDNMSPLKKKHIYLLSKNFRPIVHLLIMATQWVS